MRIELFVAHQWLSITFLLVVLLSAALEAGAQGERLPVGEFTAVRLNPAPVIDGKVSPGEWDRAFATSGMIAPFDHQLQNAETTMYLGYDDARFYFLFKCRRSAGEWKLWKSSRANDEYDFGEPSIEIWVTPPTLVPETYQNILNTYPAVYDQKFIPSRGYASLGWKGNWQLGESEDDNYYFIEASVAIKDFGFERVKDGDTWRFLLCRNALGARPRSQASWSITQGFAEIPQHPQVHFADNAPAVQLLSVLSVFTGKYRFPMAIAAPAKAGADLEVTLRFQQGKTQGANDIVTTRAISLKASERQELTLEGATPEGWKSGNFAIQVKTRDGKLLFSQAFPFEVNGFEPQTPVKPANAPEVQPLALSVMFGPESNILIVKADIFDYAKHDEVAGGTIKVIDPANNRVLKQIDVAPFRQCYSSTHVSLQGEQIPVKDFRKIAYVQNQINDITKENEKLAKQGKPLKAVPALPEFPPRPVKVECVLRDKAGNTLIENSSTANLLRFQAEWMNNTIGITDRVIPPWTPVKVEGDNISVWNRTFTLNGLGLARAITNGGVNQMNAAMRLVATLDGKQQEVTASAPAVVRRVDASVDMTGTGAAPGLTVQAQTHLEFDGFTRVTMTIAPADKAVKVDGLTLEITLPEEEATHFCTTAGGWAAVHDETPAYWSSLQTASGTLVNDFVPYIWLTNGERGLMWCADSEKGWLTETDRTHPTQELVRKDGKVTLRLHFIEVPSELTAPTTLTFAYQPFPSRPLPRGWRAILCANNDPVPDTRNTYFWFDGDWAVLWPYYSSPYPWSMETSREQFARYPIDSDHRPSVGSIAHSIGRYRDYDNNWFNELAVDWGSTPGGLGDANVTQSRGPIDFRLYHYQKWVQEARFRGLYIDENYLGAEDNWLTGNAYFKADGQLQQGYSYFGLREYYKRMMTMFYQNGVPRPNLWMHISSGAAYYAWFGDVYFEGENVEPTDLNYDYMEVLPAGRLRAIGSSVCAGGAMTMMCQSERHATQWVNKHTHQFVGWVMAHDVLPEQVSFYPILMQEGRLYEDDVTFFPYWKKDAPCRTATPDALVSAHQTAGRAMLWVVNKARKDQAVLVDVDCARLKLDPKRTIAVNAETGEWIPFDGKRLKVNMLQRDFVAVHLVERKLLKGSESFTATFENGTRADEALGSNAFTLAGRTMPSETLARCSGKTGMALDTSRGVAFWSRLHLANAEGRVRFSGLIREGAGNLVSVGPLTVSLTGGKNPATVLEYRSSGKDATPAKFEGAALAAGWHDFDLSWKDGKATLSIDGAVLGPVPISSLGIALGSGKGMLNSTQVTFGGNGTLTAVDDVRCSVKVE